MIKYLELTAPEADEFRQVKILSAEVSENDYINVGDTLFTVKSGRRIIPLPAKMSGKVIEVIAFVDEQITLLTPLLLLETITEDSSENIPVDTGDLDSNNNQNESVAADHSENRSPQSQQIKSKTTKIESRSVSVTTKTAVQQEQQPHSLDSTPLIKTNSSDTNMTTLQVSVPDIGVDSAKVIEIFIAVGDIVGVDDPLISLESDKASMDVPSTYTGKVTAIKVALEEDISEGTIIVEIEAEEPTSSPVKNTTEEDAKSADTPAVSSEIPKTVATETKKINDSVADGHASPSIRRFARELGVDISKVSGTGRKDRVTKKDVKQFVKGALSASSDASVTTNNSGTGIPEIPVQDFSKFGEIDRQPLNKIKRLTASNLHRSWLNVPHVTHNDESNISDLEDFRKQLNAEYAKRKKDIKLSPLAFIVKAVVSALQTYPQFNSSLETGGENLIYKKYINIGIAVETPNGLVVPVIKEADKLSVSEIAATMSGLAEKARNKKLTGADMSGGTFTISSLGGIGGTGFSPIVNAPEVAILGVSRNKMQPVWNGSEFAPGMMLPLSLSYDHRVIDGAEAARFTRHIAMMLEDLRRLTV